MKSFVVSFPYRYSSTSLPPKSEEDLEQSNCSKEVVSAKPKSEPRKPVTFDEKDIEEKFIKGGGPGGQKINKSSSAVQLKHIPTQTIIETQRFRDLSSNRKEARRLLLLRLDELINGELSKKNQKIQKKVKQKRKQMQRAKKKYQSEDDL